MITLPIEIGDTILTGRFKNKKVIVKEIGVDDHGLPTINGRGILKIRIEKLMKKQIKESSPDRDNDVKGEILKVLASKFMKSRSNRGYDVYLGDKFDYNNGDRNAQIEVRLHADSIQIFVVFKYDDISFGTSVSRESIYDGPYAGAMPVIKNALNGRFQNMKPKFKNRLAKESNQIRESKSDLRGSIPVQIKKEDGKYWIYIIDGDDEKNISKSGFDTKEAAERSASLKGFVMVDGKGNVHEYEFNKPPATMDNRSNDFKIKKIKKEYINRIVKKGRTESKKKLLNEVEVLDPILSKKLNEVAELERIYTQVKARVDSLMEEIGFKDIEDRYKDMMKSDPVIWKFFMEMKKTGEKIIQTKENIIEVKRHATEVETVSYQDAYLKAIEKVNAATRKVLEDELAATKNISKRIGAYSSQQRESVIREGIFDKIKSWFTKVIGSLTSILKRENDEISGELNRLDTIKNKMIQQ